jgi:CheY-like chemotaxis protein
MLVPFDEGNGVDGHDGGDDMKTVLIVEEDRRLREGLVTCLEDNCPELRVLDARGGTEAREVFRIQRVHLLIADLGNQVIDGLDLLAFMLQHRPEVPVLVLGCEEAAVTAEELRALGCVRCLEKPIDLARLPGEVREILDPAVCGHVDGISLMGFLQLLHLEKKSCTLQVRNGRREGRLEIVTGEVHDAAHNGRGGEEAALEILSWERPDIRIEEPDGGTLRAIEIPLPRLLLEAARRCDELRRYRWQMPTPLEPTATSPTGS